MERWKEEILNHFISKSTSGKVEGLACGDKALKENKL
ncbi:hypothetical protein H5U35_08565 [Candidatus Aerophobetes bacterium]|nr:hypothetical protein [Candidatus Aerophobetes bacterium]